MSPDNGATWVDHATSALPFATISAAGGCRSLAPDGKVIGSFTGVLNPGDPVRTYFFSFATTSSP